VDRALQPVLDPGEVAGERRDPDPVDEAHGSAPCRFARWRFSGAIGEGGYGDAEEVGDSGWMGMFRATRT
jgi:hypothetical protein